MPEKKVKENIENQIPDKPWITSGFKKSIKKKWSLYHKWQKSKLHEDHLKYKTHLNSLTHLKKKAEIKYYHDRAKLYGQDKAKTWRLVNEISNYKRKQKTKIDCLIDKHGNVHTDDESKANCLNNHFGTVGKDMAQKYENIDPSSLKDPLSFIKKHVDNSFVLSQTSTFEISNLIDKLNNKKSTVEGNDLYYLMTAVY